MTELIIDIKEIEEAMENYVYDTYGNTMFFNRWVDNQPNGIVFRTKK